MVAKVILSERDAITGAGGLRLRHRQTSRKRNPRRGPRRRRQRLRVNGAGALFHYMIAEPPAPPDSLGDILTVVARRATDARLSTMMIAGLAGAVIVGILLGRKGWLGAAALLAIGAYGGWGIADRALAKLYATPGSPRRAVMFWQFARFIGGLVATAAAVAALGATLLPALGYWRS